MTLGYKIIQKYYSANLLELRYNSGKHEKVDEALMLFLTGLIETAYIKMPNEMADDIRNMLYEN